MFDFELKSVAYVPTYLPHMEEYNIDKYYKFWENETKRERNNAGWLVVVMWIRVWWSFTR